MRITAFHKYCMIFLLVFMLFASISSHSFAASAIDIDKHWAKEYVDFLIDKGIWPGQRWSFDPDHTITKEEGLVWMGRLLKVAYGKLSDEAYTNKTDFRSPAKKEIDQLAGQVDMLFNIDQKQLSGIPMGKNMLYYLHLSATGKPMKEPKVYSDAWWLPASSLKQPLSREEVSMILCHVLARQIGRSVYLSGKDLEEKYNNLYRWKGESAYRDTITLYPTMIKDLKILQSDGLFEPKKPFTRGQYAVVLKRVYDLVETERKNIEGSNTEQLRGNNLLLTAATLAYQKGNAEGMKDYFSARAIDQLQKLRPLPLHHYAGELKINQAESDLTTIRISGTYQSADVGLYQVDYLLKKDEKANNPYKWIIESVSILQL